MFNCTNLFLKLHPRTKKAIEVYGIEDLLKNIICIEPIGFLDMISLEKNADLIVTDSGGVQKEAFLQGTKCITLRTSTEWIEIIESGWNTLIDPQKSDEISKTIFNKLNSGCPTQKPLLYGKGFASKFIINHIIDYIN